MFAISRIVYNVPPKLEGVFEVFVTHMLLAQVSGGSAVCATAQARQQFSNYMNSDFRKEKLARDENFLRLTKMHEQLANEQFQRKVRKNSARKALDFSDQN